MNTTLIIIGFLSVFSLFAVSYLYLSKKAVDKTLAMSFNEYEQLRKKQGKDV